MIRSNIGLTGNRDEFKLPNIQEKQRMKAIETLRDEIKVRDEKIVEWKDEYRKLQNVCNLLVEKLGLFIDVSQVKEMIRRECGFEVD